MYETQVGRGSPRRVLFSTLGVLTLGAAVAGCGGGGGGGRGSTAAPIQSSQGGFQNVSPLAIPRVHHTATLLDDGRILVTGGLINRTDATASVEILDPSTGTVSSAASMFAPRMYHRAVLLKTKKVLVIGGQSTRYGAALRSTELFDPQSGSWTTGPNLSEGRSGAFVAEFDQGRQFLIAGGLSWANGVPNVLASADRYLADSNTISAAQPMSGPRCLGEAVTQSNDQIVLVSGFSSVAQGTPAHSEVFDIASGQFIPVTQPAPRAEAGVVNIGFDTYAIAGVNSSGAAQSKVEGFNGQVWANYPDLTSARASASATLTGAGQALLIGGRQGTQALGSVEEFPSGVAPVGTGQALADPRYEHTATLAGDTIYVIGGLTDGEQILASIEAYAPAGVTVPGAGAGKGARADGTSLPPGPSPGTLAISALSPNYGVAGSTVRVTGTGFASLASGNLIRFNGVLAQVTAVNVSNAAANTLDCVVPAAATTGPVSIQVGTTSASGPVFTVGSAPPSGPAPTIYFILPSSGKPFYPVSITGKDFGTSPVVTFNGVPAISIVSFSIKNIPLLGTVQELVVLVPPGASTGPLIVHNGTLQSAPKTYTVN